MFKIKNGQILNLLMYTNKNQTIRLVKTSNCKSQKIIYEGLASTIPCDVIGEIDETELDEIIAENNVLVMCITKIRKEKTDVKCNSSKTL